MLPRGCQPSLLEILSFQIRVESNFGELLVARVLSVIDERRKGTWLESHIWLVAPASPLQLTYSCLQIPVLGRKPRNGIVLGVSRELHS